MILLSTSLEYLSTSYSMNFLALNDDVKFIIADHLQSDRKINKIFMNESDDNLQKILFNEVKEMSMHIEEVCIDLVNDNKKFDENLKNKPELAQQLSASPKCSADAEKKDCGSCVPNRVFTV